MANGNREMTYKRDLYGSLSHYINTTLSYKRRNITDSKIRSLTNSIMYGYNNGTLTENQKNRLLEQLNKKIKG